MNFFKRLFGKKSRVISDPERVPDAYKQQVPILDELGSETINCTPENWTNAVLLVTCDGKRIDYSIKNHRGEHGKATLTPRVAQLAEQLYSLMASHGDKWTTAEFQYDQDGEDWAFKSKFTYD